VSMAAAPWLYCLVAGVFAAYGIELRSGKMMALTMEPFIFAGGYFGILVMVAYTGRRYYLSSFLKSIGARVTDDIPGYAVLGMRMFIGGLWNSGVWRKLDVRSIKQLVQQHIGDKEVYQDEVRKSLVESVADLFKTEFFNLTTNSTLARLNASILSREN